MTALIVERAGPLTTVQDLGRPGMLAHGISASGPMDRIGFAQAGATGRVRGTAIECGSLGVAFRVEGGPVQIGFGGGIFTITRNGTPLEWPGAAIGEDRDVFDVRTGPAGNYGYIRFDHEIDVPLVLGSRATNVTVGLGGFEGRGLEAGDRIGLTAADVVSLEHAVSADPDAAGAPIRFVWGLHADLFSAGLRQRFLDARFTVTAHMDRMGVRLDDAGKVFADQRILTLVSDAVAAGDIQILGDGTPVVLMRDHQPTGGYPRIGTIIGADLDRFAQTRPGTSLSFQSVTVDRAREMLTERRRT